MEFLSGLEFRKKFAQLFEINPSLTNIEAYTILKANSFDVPKTCLDIAENTQELAQEGEFRIPKGLWNNSKDESDSEIDYGSQHLRSAFDLHVKSVEKPKESKLPRSNKSAKSFKPETRTTPFVSKIAGILFHRELRPIRISEDQTSVESGYKEYRERIVSAYDSAEKFLRESRDSLIECQAGDSVLVQDGKYSSLSVRPKANPKKLKLSQNFIVRSSYTYTKK
ncbi:hypothetical protein BOTCAL_0082g00010 [Botryotinia calthae]|uniref:Uncharacterized protein n=1 Tax=Botryotinia calthae TaxID=38488 RepID=A0A4Y8DA45_9HELO|nr:hypothetical protein BOTCAL_0082g00010 [Botryotinia calthae]